MNKTVDRRTVGLSAYPDRVVYLRVRVNSVAGLKCSLGLGRQFARSVEAKRKGRPLREDDMFSLLPSHVGMRRYRHGFDSLERPECHGAWWR